ncbi:MAG: hypothetical protein H0U52_10365 [Chloroflexi bacterium]|nr:hypothetical protein [Chloroflexota bacterium]
MPKLSFALPISRPVALVVLTIVAAACGGVTASPTPSSPPGSSGSSGSPPTSGPSVPPGASVGEIDHKTGSTDVILRLEEGGGFVPIEFNASQAPDFTLFGDGVIVFKRIVATFPEPDAGGVVHSAPWRTAKLAEDQIQELLDFALGAGGLGGARDKYLDDTTMDAPTSYFTVRAGGLDKTVEVAALFEIPQPGPDQVARAAFFKLSQRLKDFDRGGTIDSDVYVPERYRGMILEREPAPELKPIAWPWPAIAVTDFKKGPGDGTGGSAFPHREMTANEIAALKLTDVAGGLQGPVLKGPDGKLSTFILRPLLVDETE